MIERWLALRGDPASKANTASGANTASEDADPGEVSATPDPVLMAKIAALRAAEDEVATPEPAAPAALDRSEPVTGSLKERLAARRAELGQVRRDAGAAVLDALDATRPKDPTPAPHSASDEADGGDTDAGDADTADTDNGETPPLRESVAEALEAASPPSAPRVEATAPTPASTPTTSDDSVGRPAAEPDQPTQPVQPTQQSPGLPGTDERRARLARMVRNRVVGEVEDDRLAAASDVVPSRGEDASTAALPDAPTPGPSPAAGPEEAAPAAPAAEDTGDDDIIAALRQLPMTSAHAVSLQRPEHGRHKGASAPTAPPSVPRDDAVDPALQEALRAVEVAEQASEAAPATAKGRRGAAHRPDPQAEERTTRAKQPPLPSTDEDEAPTLASGTEPPTTRSTVPPLNPTIAAALRASMGIEDEAPAPTAPSATAAATSAAHEAPAPRPSTTPSVSDEGHERNSLDAADPHERVSRAADRARARRTPAPHTASDSDTPHPQPDDSSPTVTEPSTDAAPTPPATARALPAQSASAGPSPAPTASAASESALPDSPPPAPRVETTAEPPSDAPPPPTTSARRATDRSREDRGLRAPERDITQAPTSPKAPPGVVQFQRRRSTRQLLGMSALLCFLGTIGTGFLAWETRGTTEIAVAGTLGVMTLILWSAFSTAAPATLTIDRGLLDIVSKESRHRFDLASPYTEITVRGRPGKRNWQVQIHRRSMKPYVIDSSMVDPEEFQPVLEHYREIAAEAAAENERRREQR